MFSVLVSLVVYILLKPCLAVETNVTRSLQDSFSVSNCSLCANFNQATCSREGVCRCPTAASTFFIYKQRCNSPSSFINDHDCLSWPRGKNFLKLIDLTSASSSTFSGKTFSSCSVPLERTFEYLGRGGNWMTHRLQGDSPVFAVVKVNSRRRMLLKIRGNNDFASFAGRIIRVDLLCKGSEGEKKSCLILKAKGMISTTRGASPSQASAPTFQHGDLQTRASPSESQRNQAKVPTTPRIHYIGSQRKPRHTSTSPNNITVITLERINGAVSIDKTNRKGDPVVVAIISVLGAIACVLVIAALFAWFVIKYYRRFRPRHRRNTLQSIVIRNNQDVQQNAIQMTAVTTTGRPEPVYSELPDVLEATNRNRSGGCGGPADISIPVENQDDFFIIRNPLQYNTLPRARKLTDPLPATPYDRSKTPDLRLTHRTTSTVDPNATRTAQFLSEVSKNFYTPVFQDLTRRKRSCTDVKADGIFFENIPAKGLWVDLSDAGKEKPKSQSTAQSVYEDLSETSKQRKISIYEPLEKATLQPPDVRETTLERITNQEGTLDAFLKYAEENPVPEYHVLEQLSPEQEAIEISPTNNQENPVRDNEDGQEALCIGANTKGSFSPPIRKHHAEKGPINDKDQGCTNQGLECDMESTVDKKSVPNRKHSEGDLFEGASTKGPYTISMKKHHAEEGLNIDRSQGCSSQRHDHDDVSNLEEQSAQASGQLFQNDQFIGLARLHNGCSHSRGRIREQIFLRPRSKSWEL